MALNPTTLGLAIATNMVANGLLPGPQTNALANAIAAGVVTAMTTDAVVDPAGTGTPLTAPTGGGPVTGQGKIT